MAAKKGNSHGFKKGQSGNPGGRPKTDPDVMRIFRAHEEKAAMRICKLISSKDDYIARQASEYVMNRLHGRPRESVEVKGDIPSFVALLPAKIDDADVWEAHAQKLINGTVEH